MNPILEPHNVWQNSALCFEPHHCGPYETQDGCVVSIEHQSKSFPMFKYKISERSKVQQLSIWSLVNALRDLWTEYATHMLNHNLSSSSVHICPHSGTLSGVDGGNGVHLSGSWSSGHYCMHQYKVHEFMRCPGAWYLSNMFTTTIAFTNIQGFI